MIDVSKQRRSLLADATALDHLPPELLHIIRDHSSTTFLDAVSEAALSPPLTERIFVHFEDAVPDICARWILNPGDELRRRQITSAFARILPFAPYLSVFLQCPADDAGAVADQPSLRLTLSKIDETSSQLEEGPLLQTLVSTWRLLSFDSRTYTPLISPSNMQSLFKHRSRAVRYLAIRIFCQLLRASDLKLEALLDEHVSREDAIIEELDGSPMDYGFLSLHEHGRVKNVLKLREQVRQDHANLSSEPEPQALTPYVISYGDAILPRPLGPIDDPSSLVMTATTTKNLEQLASMLRKDDPILIHGLPGVGKTALVHDVAKQLGMYSSMVTLHLNEQTDAKMLVGLYSTDSKPGTFQWRPGVLTTAVREGRWVLVEDLDRAPTEVLSTLLPLIERKELLIPTRGETIRAANNFRLFATVRTSRGMNGRENLPSLVGMRFWQSLYTEPLASSELEQVITQTQPILRKFIPGILAVHSRLSRLGSSPAVMSRGRSVMDRQMNLRDLLKWCRRLQECLLTTGSTTGDEPIRETTRDLMFMEAVDCFVGSCPDVELGKRLVYAIAEEMHLSKERADHYVSAYIPSLDENDLQLTIGRAQLRKKKMSMKLQKSKRPFASTAHAKKLLEQIAVAVRLNEPVLLVGETGIGKTTVVQQLAETLNHKLIAVNLSQQSEVGDLLGGFKPVNVRSLAVPLKEEFEDLFAATGISASKNQKYLEQVGKCFAKGQWSKVSKLWKEAPKMFVKIITEMERMQSDQADARNGDAQPTKRRKTQSKLETLLELRPRWDSFARSLEQFDVQISGGSGSFAFSFVEGNLVKAVRNGDWVLLDEINLASSDTLESIADLLAGPSEKPSILLSETGEIEKIVAHPSFRIFGAMNPATDIGKRDLPIGIRSRFTELFVRSPDTDLKDLLTIIKAYMGSSTSKNDQAADDIARLYLNTKRMAEEKRLVDGANEVPHFSLRTLTRVLSYVTNIAPLYGIRRALYEGFSMGFLTLLNNDSEQMLVPLIFHHLLDKHGNPQALLSQTPKHPTDGKRYVKFQNQNRDRQYWLFQGEEAPVKRDDYIITPYVERNLLNVVRATSTRRFPVLIQGPTSAGKTSMIEYLANFTGNKFVRINNHEHTDLQEYLGTYISGSDGKLRFQEGILVQAMRQGHWIVLDELNLAPTDVLEALNRLLDDNRELLIPETQEVVRPHENFILFATQNPPGLYGGRKVLSRAFRNRFLELHFDDIPEDELEFILQQRSRNTSPPDCRRIVTVYKELSRLRQTSRLFEQKDSFATLRDLFRWALRDADTREEIASHGFMLLAERVRNDEERAAVKDIIEKVFKVTIEPQKLYSADVAPELKQLTRDQNSQGVVWTHAMRRLYVLVSRALRNNEPVLLVGETGCGKTTVCQLLAEALKKQLHIVNAHQNTETGDLIGSQRPVRNRGAILEALGEDLSAVLSELGSDASGTVEERLERYNSLGSSIANNIPVAARDRIMSNAARSKALFEWSDGALVESMRDGQFFLLDEISLADDSVLERLNSVLEPQRTLLLAEKGVTDSFVTASKGFQFFATMNPGGDFGKKELSPALRNRFTEIWVPPLSESDDIHDIVQAKLNDGSKGFVDVVVQFATWFGQTFRPMATTPFSIRELLAWVQFINTFQTSDPVIAVVHGASAIFIDSIGANPSAMLAVDLKAIQQQRQECLAKLGGLMGKNVSAIYETQPDLVLAEDSLSIGDFNMPRSSAASPDTAFAFHAPTTRLNAMRVVRALQMQKPILLEGSPGVGKTSLVVALAQACGRPLTRINLSDQTDLMDLFGTDVPVEGEEAGNFAWRDAPFLQAMQKGEWVLLDEMNLASQSVLEGLNACLDHRGEVYISELDQVFKRHPDFCLFAAQNPHQQGGGRKGLPSSFVNRFVVVYADVFTDEDLKLIAAHNFPDLPTDVIGHLIQFVTQIEHQLVVEKTFGLQGGPWEFNLRDVLRWLQLLDSPDPLLKTGRVDDFLDIVVRQRFRTQRDRDEVNSLFSSSMGTHPRGHHLHHDISSKFGQVGLGILPRNPNSQPQRLPNIDVVPRLPEIESLMICVKQNIPCILSSPSGFGKSALLEYVAALAGKRLVVFPMNADIDTMDLVGGFEQADPLREVNATLRSLRDYLQESVMALVPAEAPGEVLRLLHLLDGYSGDSAKIPEFCLAIEAVLARVSPESEVAATFSQALQLLQGPLVLANPRFEWLDGVIVKAMQAGQWLVLDNANMCNASVLDRLNSLLEPNGCLIINEHCGPGGEPRVIKPHPEFRIFLTTDPRYGELSRAMRNRAIEIHILNHPSSIEASFSRVSDIESSLQRYRMPKEHNELLLSAGVSPDNSQISLENLSLQDILLLPRFATELSRQDPQSENYALLVKDLIGFLQSQNGSKVTAATFALYSKLPENISLNLSSAQPIHSLNNLSVAQLLPDVSEAGWNAVRYEFHRQLHRLEGTVGMHQSQARTAKLTSLSRLQRSLISDRVAAVSKDSTVNLGRFLSSLFTAMRGYLDQSFESLDSWKARYWTLRLVSCYLERTIALAASVNFDEARFQAHLAQGTTLLNKHLDLKQTRDDSAFVSHALVQLKDDFVSGFKLSTGLSMEMLWNQLRPIPIPDQPILDRSLELELLGIRFDALRWKASASLSDLSKAQQTLERAYKIVRDGQTSADELVKDLTEGILALEARIGSQESEMQPFLVHEFEALRQLAMLRSTSVKLPEKTPSRDLAILSNVPTKAGLMFASSTQSASLLQSLDNLAYQDQFSWDGKLTGSLWHKLQTIGSVSLNSLALLETELPVIGRNIAELSTEITSDPILELDELLWQLLVEVFATHDPRLSDAVTSAYSQAAQHIDTLSTLAHSTMPSDIKLFDDFTKTIESPQLRQETLNHFLPAIVSIAAAKTSHINQRAYYSALAWTHFSIGVIKLYVPDRVFDPQLRPMMEREFSEELRSQLEAKILALRVFEKAFTGQDTNVRIELLEEQLIELGPLPKEVEPVFRPARSELSQLHAEFSNVLKAVTGPGLLSALQLLESNPTESRDSLRLITENVKRLLDRLSTRFEAYQDMTRPAASLLRCLLVGLSLCDSATAFGLSPSTEQLVQASPFFDGTSLKVCDGQISAQSFEFLQLMSTGVAVEGLDRLQVTARESLFQCFHSFYDDWNVKLESDRKAEEAKGSLYRFRGSLEDEEEIDEQEFNELFPHYDDEETETRPETNLDNVRNISLKVAQSHRRIFLDLQDPSTAIQDLCTALGQRISNETREQPNVDRSINGVMLASTTLLLDERLQALKSTSTGSAYNFYTDPNLSEVRQLVTLAHNIKARFRELQQVDEIGHMQPLVDVVLACDKLLEFVHAEPLAKILPKVEQLHTYVYEWEFGGWASRIYSVLALHNSLTDTVIRWRRLELSTWAKLFDMEETKCQDDAYSWWFIAYQVVIAGPLSIVDSPTELKTYAVSLVKNLELYFSSSIVGQFQTRVALLKQLESHLQLLVKDYPTLSIICRSLNNFINYISRYEVAATSAIQKGRLPIEKKMKDVLLMASWKDTNITALRESARKSHQKLFRLVRKFRGVLGKEMKTIVEQGLPDEIMSNPASKPAEAFLVDVADVPALSLSEKLPGWLESHKRLLNASMTVSVMKKVAESSDMASNAAQILDEFISSLNSSMAELKKETPPTLTDENKDEVKHIKTRKRKLFADTLRELRNMGLRYNLAQDQLSLQDSLSTVLASVPPIELPGCTILAESDYYFHKVLDLAPRVRAARQEYSEELTGAEVVRSIGFVEGMINFALAQRNSLATFTESLSSLQASAIQFTDLGGFQNLGNLAPRETDSNWSRLLPWLIQILSFAIRLVQAHSRLGGVDDDSVVQQLKPWVACFEAHLAQLNSLAQLPTQLTSEVHDKLQTDFARDLAAVRTTISEAAVKAPNVSFILQKLDGWTQIATEPLEKQSSTIDLATFAQGVSNLCDTVLVAVEAARKAGMSVPRKEEEAGWLKEHSDALAVMVNQLHMKSIEKEIKTCTQMLQKINLEEPQLSNAAMSLVALASPILEQFVVLCRQSIERSVEVHRATVHMAYNLTKAFTQIASQGFCTPQEKSDETSGDSGQVESGTGLGDGEGAEDISKDIQSDEDLTELAQEANKEDSGDVEDQKDAVDMADEELEGEMGSVDGRDDEEDENSQKGEEEEENDDMDEEAGDVDDLDPTAVDEKMWDGDDDKAEKDQQGDKADGQKQDDDEQMPVEDDAKKDKAEEKKEEKEVENKKNDEKEGEDENAEEGEEEDEEDEAAEAKEELNRQDQDVAENDALELPEDIDMDFDDQGSEASSDSDDLDLMSDAEEDANEAEEPPKADDEDEELDDAPAESKLDQEASEDEVSDGEPETEDKPGADDEVQDDPEAEPEPEQEGDDSKDQAPPLTDNATADLDNAAPSDVKSSGQDQNAESMDLDEQFQANAAQQEDGDMGDGAADQDTSAGSKGAMSRSKERIEKPEQDGDSAESAKSDPFKKLGDALEKYHRQQSDIQEAKPEDDAQQKNGDMSEADQAQRDFQHVQHDDAAEDTQALGKAEEDEVQPIDESMAIDEEKEDPSSRVMNEDADEPKDEIPDKMDTNEQPESKDADNKDKEDRSGVKTRQGNYNREPTPSEDEDNMVEQIKNEEEAVDETSTQLSTTHISDEQRPLRDFAECMRQWSDFQSKSHALSLSLTSQLRLILTPSQSTKLSGSFRTGKRLNIKRIIPYIASSYKRDKIWMRRSIPTKRTYQILLCVDDSQSMGESSSGSLAMESLVMVSRSLAMLEAGQVGVMGFGADVFTAHQLTEPFGADAGAKVLQKFNFAQDRTDIALLIRQTIDTFRAARQQSNGNSDLWQLSLILSDGLTPSSAHDSIRRLLREAIEERIMIVFIIMDDTDKKKGDSVLELKEAKFVNDGGDSRVVIERYLDTFPFQYYLIVHNLEDLPGALAGLLRTWFAEVAA